MKSAMADIAAKITQHAAQRCVVLRRNATQRKTSGVNAPLP